MTRPIIRCFLAGATSLSIFAASIGTGFAHGEATGIVKERMDLMDAMGDAVRTVGDMVRGKADYNRGEAMKAGEIISNHSGQALLDLFPEGSLKKPSEAHPKIWMEWDSFEKFANDLKAAGAGLEKAATDGPAEGDVPPAVEAAFANVGKGCASCHKAYRLKR